jgi:serine/threonine protein kinase/formylglycine-generating enzyme required for sulfatase activity
MLKWLFGRRDQVAANIEPPPPLRPPEVGDRLGGRYDLIRLLGEGGAGRVFQARDNALGIQVAVKLIPERAGVGEASPLKAEALAAMRLAHRFIVRTYTWERFGGGERAHGGERFAGVEAIIMELIPGGTLAERIACSSNRKMRIEQAIGFTIDALEGLAYAHDQDVLHNDIKPHNLLVGIGEQVKLCDFGISGTHSDSTHQSRSVAGTVTYLSPERIQGQPHGQPSDLYSLGAVLFELLVGAPPFGVGFSSIQGHLDHPVPELPGVPPEIVAVVEQALAKRPLDRFASAHAMRAALIDAGFGSRWEAINGTSERTSTFRSGPIALPTSPPAAVEAPAVVVDDITTPAIPTRSLHAEDAPPTPAWAAAPVNPAQRPAPPAPPTAPPAPPTAPGAAQPAAPAPPEPAAAQPTQRPTHQRPTHQPIPTAPPEPAARPQPAAEDDRPQPRFVSSYYKQAGEVAAAPASRSALTLTPPSAAPVPSSVYKSRSEAPDPSPAEPAPVVSSVYKPREGAPRASATRPVPLPEGMVLISERDVQWRGRTYHVTPFALDAHPVTNAAYAEFVQGTGAVPPAWWNGRTPPQGLLRHPVVGVRLRDARAYAAWHKRRLPSALEWLAAAQTRSGKRFPWGEECGERTCHCPKAGHRSTDAVGVHPGSRTVDGVEDLFGNIWEWTEEAAQLPPTEPNTQLVFGASFRHACTAPEGVTPVTTVFRDAEYMYLGFRCAGEAR